MRYFSMLILLCAASPRLLAAQFSTPLPSKPGALAAHTEEFRQLFHDARSAGIAATIADTAVQAMVKRVCATAGSDSTTRASCLKALPVDTARMAANNTLPSLTTPYLHFGFVFSPRHNRGEMANYLRQSGSTESLQLVANAAAQVSEHDAYVASDLLTGLAGRVLMSVSYATVVENSDIADTVQRRIVEADRSRMLRLINNGGSLATRVTAPIYATGGVTFSSAAAVTLNAGVLPTTSQSDSLHFSGNLALEFVGALGVRDLGVSSSTLGDILLGVRLGYAFGESDLVSSRPGITSTPYVQLAFGVRASSAIVVSALYTTPLFQPGIAASVPRLLVSLKLTSQASSGTPSTQSP